MSMWGPAPDLVVGLLSIIEGSLPRLWTLERAFGLAKSTA